MPKSDNQKSTKDYYLPIDGQEIPVSEEVYRAYKRPAWAELSVKNVKNDAEMKKATAAQRIAASASEYTVTVVFKEVGTGKVLGGKEITAIVSPGKSDYGFELADDLEIVAGELPYEGTSIEDEEGNYFDNQPDALVQVTIKATTVRELGYEKVRILPLEVEQTEGSNGNLQVWMYASVQDKKWFNVAVTGWGSKGTGFRLEPDEESTLDAYVFADQPGTYKITFTAVDTSTDDETVIATGTAVIKVCD